jgi:APA family basic amino acid/polyamine antiporter
MANDAASGPGPASVTAVAATAIVVADMVGVGVFTSLGFQVKDITSGFSIILLWLIGGIVALCGAICYAELACMFPRNSGEYNFLTRSYHPAVGFLAGWLSATVGFAAPVALAAMAFGEYAKSIAPGAPPLVLGLAVIWAVSLVHLTGNRHGSLFQIVSTLVKLALIAPFAISLVFVMYSYSGWNAATYIIGEIKDPPRALPRALLFGTLIVVALYVALNAVFLYTTPISALAGQIDVAVIAGTHIFGEGGGRLVGGLICLGLISTVSAMVWIGPRVTVAMGEDNPLLRVFSRRRANGVPMAAILFQAVVSSLLLFTQSFEAVLDFIQFSLIFCSFLAVLGVIKLRITRPDLPRPFRAWGFPVTPIVFLSVTGFMMYYLITTRPMQSLLGFLMMLAGLAVYGLASRASWQVSGQGAASK